MAQQQEFIVKSGLTVETGNAKIGGTLAANLVGVTTASVNTATGYSLSINDLLITDVTTVASTLSVATYIGQSTINSTGTITTAVNLWIAGPPIGAGSTVITDSWAAYINTGSVYIGDSRGNPNGFAGNALQVKGGLSVGNGINVTGGGVLEGVFFINGSPVVTQATQNTGTTYFNADVHIDTTSNSYSTQTGALILGRTGGAGIAGNVYVGGYLAVLTTATILGNVPATSTTSGSFTVKGGVGITGDLYANSGNFTTAVVADTLQSLNTGSTSLQVGGYAQIAKGVVAQDLTLLDSSSATGYLAAPLMVTGGAYIGANLIVDSTLSNAVQVTGGMMVNGDFRLHGQGLFDSNINVANTSYIHGAEIITTATIATFAVSQLTAGTDTAVSTSTGAVLVWSTATLQSLTNRGGTTTNAISIANTLTVNSVFVTGDQINSGTVHIINTTPASSQTGALVVDGGLSVGQSLYVSSIGYVNNAQILTTATIGSYGVSAIIAGTDTAVNTATGAVTVWDTSQLQTVTERGATTNRAITISNTSSSTSTTTGALVLAGGIGLGDSLNAANSGTFGGSVSIGGKLNVGSDATITGQITLGGPVTINDTTNAISTDSGALQVGGGIGIGGDLWVGGTLINTNNLTVNQNFSTLGTINVHNTASSTSTTTGAMVIDGGLGVGGAINAGQTSFVNGAQILTTATVGQFGVSAIQAGTDISVSSATGVVQISDISTLDTVASRGHVTTSTIDIQNTLTTQNLLVGQFLTVNDGTTLYTLTATNKVDFQSIEDSINIYTGAVKIAGGLGVQKYIYASGVFDQNARVITTATIPTYAVTSLTAGTDTAVSTSTGDVIVWNTSTLQTVTDRGHTTNNPIGISNAGPSALEVVGGVIFDSTLTVSGPSRLATVTATGIVNVTNATQSNDTGSGAVVVKGGLGVGGNIYANAVYDNNARVVTSATIGSYGVSLLVAGTDTAVNTSTGQVTVWNTSTLQTVTNRGSTTTNALTVSNNSQSTDTNSGAIVVQGGIGLGGNLNVGGTANIGSDTAIGGSASVGGSLSIGTTATVGDSISIANKSFIAGAEIVTTATISQNAVARIYAGTDTAVNTETGYVTVWNTSTLQTITSRGSTTDRAITITNNSQAYSTISGALVVAGGVGISGDLFVGKSAVITGNLTVLGTQTIVDSTSTAIIDPMLDIGGGQDRTELVTNDGLNKGISLHYFTATSDTMFIGREVSSGKFVVKNEYGKGYPTNTEFSNNGLYAGAILNDLLLTGTANSTSTTTGALIVDGGVGIVKDLFLGGTLRVVGDAYIGGSAVVTTGTIGNYGVTSLTAGTDTAVSTSTGRVTIWNTSTLQSITNRGNTTTNAIKIFNTSLSTSSFVDNALYVAGGVGIDGPLSVRGQIYGSTASITSIQGVSAKFYGDDNGFGALYAGIPTGFTALPSTVLQLTANIDDYVQTNFQNLGTGPIASVDWVATAANGTDGSGFVDMGITSPNWDGSQSYSLGTAVGPNDGYLYNYGGTGVGQGNLVLGTAQPGSQLRITVGNPTSTNITLVVGESGIDSTNANTGSVVIKGGVGISKSLSVANTLTANQVFDNGNRVVTSVIPVAGPFIGITSATTTGTATTFTIINEGVQQLQGSTFIQVTTSTGTVQILNAGVNELYGQVDIDVSQHTGTIYISNTSTLQSVTNRGNSTTNAIRITNLSASSDYQSGALTVAGGVGIGGSLNVNNLSFVQGGQIVTTSTIAQFAVTNLQVGTDTAITTSTGAAVIWSTATLQSITGRNSTTTNYVNFANTTNSVNTTTGGVTFGGGVGIAKDVYIGGTLFYSNQLNLASTTDSTSTTSGALIVSGGVGIGKNLNVGGLTHFWNTTDSTSTTTGAVIIDGGLGVAGTINAGNMYSQGSIVLTEQSFKGVLSIRAGTDTAVNTSTGYVVVWNTSTFQTVSDRGNSTTNAIYISNSTTSFNSQSGALTVAGGVGIGQDLNIGGNFYGKNLNVSNTINSLNAGLYLNSANTASSVYANGIDLLGYDSHVHFVTQYGNDNNDGRRIQSAFRTIKKALSVANSGDVVYMEAGTYTEDFPLTIPQGVTVKGAGLRAVIVQPTTATNQANAFLLNGETTISDFTVRGFFKPGYALAFANNAKISLKSPYIERFTVLTQGSTTSTSDPYGFASGDAGGGAYIDGSVIKADSLEPAMLFNEATFIVPNSTGIYMTNGVRSELLNGFVYFADKAIYAVSNTTGLGGTGQTKLKLGGVTGTLTVGDTLYYKTPGGTTLASGQISSVNGNYVYLTGACWGFNTPSTRTAKSVSAVGNTIIDTSVSKFGGASAAFDGNSSYLSVPTDPDFNFGTGDYTIEFWVYRTGSPAATQILFDMRATGSSLEPVIYLNSSYQLLCGVNAVAGAISSGFTVPLTTWTHVAVSKTGANTKLFINGTQYGGTYSYTGTNVQSSVIIGARQSDLGADFVGNIDDLRITKGLGRYTANFTAPTSALVSDANTVLMLHMDGALGSTAFLDDNSTVQVIYSTGTTMSHATSIDMADYHQFGAELRCIGSAAVFGNSGVTANGTGTDLKLIAFNMSHIGSGSDISDDVSKTVQANETVQLNGGIIYYQTVDQNGDFRVGQHFLVNQQTGQVSFANAAVNLSNLSSLSIGTGVGATLLTPTSISVGDIALSGDSIVTHSGSLTIDPAGTSTTINSNLQVNGTLDVSQGITSNGSQVLTTSTLVAFGVAQLFAGTDTAVSTSYGLVTVWNTSTLQTVTDRGHTTTNAINITNTSTTALQVGGSVAFGGTATIAGAVYISNGGGGGSTGTVTTIQTANDKFGALVVKGDSGGRGQLSIQGYTTSSFRLDLGANTDEQYGIIQSWNGSTPQDLTVQKQGGNLLLGNLNSSYQVFVQNRYESTSTNTGALVVPYGGIGINGNLFAGGTVFANTLTANTASILLVAITSTTNATNTMTGSLVVTGGVGIGGNLYGSAIYDNGSRVVTNATIGNVGVSSLYGGTDTAVSSQTGVVYVWNTSTLASVTRRGNTTTSSIYISNLTSTTNLGTGALIVDGGTSVGKNLYVGGNATVVGTQNTFGTANPITVGSQTPTVGILNASTSTTYQLMLSNAGSVDGLAFGINNAGFGTIGTFGLGNGDLSFFAGNPGVPSLNLQALTGQVQVTALNTSTATTNGALVVGGGVGIGGNINAGGYIKVANTSYVANAQIITTATISQFAVSSLTAGADLSVTTSTGAVTINSTATLQSVTNRGAITSNGITISNTGNAINTSTGALVVAGGFSVAKDGYIGGNLFVGGSAVITQGTLGTQGVTSITAGTDTAVSTSTGGTVIWNTSTFDSITRRGSSTTATIYINNTSSSTGVLSGALQVAGGVGIGNNLYVQGTISAGAGFLGLNPASIFQNTSSVTVTDTGTIHQVAVTISSSTNTVFNLTGVQVYTTTTSTGTNSGALVVAGGVGIGGRLNVANTSYVNGAEIVTTATIAAYGVNTIIGGTDTAVLTSGTTIYIWNTSTLQTITNRGFTTTNKINIANTTNGAVGNGALQVSGGAYITKDFIVGGDTTLIGNLTVLGTQTTIYSTATSISDPVINLGAPSDLGPQLTDDGLDKGVLVHYNTGSTTATDTHSFFGMQRSSEKFMYITRTQQQGRTGLDNPFTGVTYGGALFGNIQLSDTTNATSTNSGALQVAGGVGIARDLYVNGNHTNNGNVIINSTTSATSTTTGALQVVGGVGIQGNLYVGGTAAFVNGFQVITTATLGTGGVGIVNITAGTDTAVSTATGSVVIWNTSTLQTVTSRGNATTSTIIINNTSSSTSTNTGALIVAGGVGIAGNLSIGGTLNLVGNETAQSGLTVSGLISFTNTTNSTSTSTGAVVVGGGVGLGGNLYVGGNTVIAGNNTVLGGETVTGIFTASNTATVANNILVGNGATTRGLNPVEVIASGSFTGSGDAQSSVYVLRMYTTASNILTTTGLGVVPSNIIALPNNATYTFKATVTARSTSTNDEAGWLFDGVISRYGNAGTTVIKVVNKTKLYASQTAFDCTVTADTVNGALQFSGTSDGKPMRFVAKVETVEVTN